MNTRTISSALLAGFAALALPCAALADGHTSASTQDVASIDESGAASGEEAANESAGHSEQLQTLANELQTPEESVPLSQSDTAPPAFAPLSSPAGYLDEIAFLQQRADRRRSGAAAAYTFAGGAALGSAILFGMGACDRLGNDVVYDDPGPGYVPGPRTQERNTYRCRRPPHYGRMELRATYTYTTAAYAGFVFAGGALTFGLLGGLPSTRAAKAHRAAAEDLILHPEHFEHWKRNAHMGALQQRAGRNMLIASSAAGAATIISSALWAATNYTVAENKARGAAIASSVGVAMLAIPGAILYTHGRKLSTQDTPAREIQASVTPIFYGDGAGVSLWMGF